MRRGTARAATRSEDLDGALGALEAPALRALIADLLNEVDDDARARIARRLIDRAARAASGSRFRAPAGESRDLPLLRRLADRSDLDPAAGTALRALIADLERPR